jgi:hypothetical protein
MRLTITRVELRHALGHDYDKLDRAMAARGFHNSYVAGSIRYHMPGGTYLRESADAQADLKLASEAMRDIGKRSASIFVGVLKGTAAGGLRERSEPKS